MLIMQQLNHPFFADNEDHARADSRGAAHSDRLAGQTTLAEEISGSQHRDYGFLADLRHHRQLDAACLNVRDIPAGVSLLEDGLASPVFEDGLGNSRRIEKGPRAE